jgi:hypothetical protein
MANNAGTGATPPTATSGGNNGGGSNSSNGTSNGGSSGGSSSSGGNSSSTAPSSAPSFSNLQRASGWGQFGQGPPNFVDCSPSPCNGISFSMTQGINSPSQSGSSTQFYLGGTTPYSDGLWNNHLIGPLSSQGTFDNNGTLVPSLHNFTYDVDFYAPSFDVAEAVEFDINQFFDNMNFIFGHECRIDSGNEWDVWDAENAQWVSTGVPCQVNNNAWNHVTLQVQRTSDNHMVYQSITMNGQTYNLGWTFGHGSGGNWYGLTINFQMDGDYKQDGYSVYLDNLNLSYQ